jgi:DNA processing protein
MPRAWIALNSIKGLGPVRIRQLIDRYAAPEAIFAESAANLARMAGISEEVVTQMRDPALFARADEQIVLAGRLGVRIVTIASADYPPLLREIFAPPPVVYVKGAMSTFGRHAVAIVGTRHPSPYGQRAAAEMSAGLAKNGIAVISGLALGVDTISHQACLDNGQPTVAVLGCGLDTIYPPANKKLAERIEAQGALVSEFSLGTPPDAFNFPRRNRIISGLSAGVCVIEAGRKSGSLITANYAVQQGREVFSVPGSIFSEKSEGTFNLIKDGATPVRSARDIVAAIQVVTHALGAPAQNSALTRMSLDLLSAEEKAVLGELSGTPQRIDEIAGRAQTAVAELFGTLLNLELKGFISQVAGQQYVRI